MKILILRFSSIGDIVLTTPVVRCIKKQYPEAEIHYCTKKSYVSLLEHNPYISKIIPLEGKVKHVIREIRKTDYDFVIDLHNNLRTLILKAFLPLSAKTKAFPKINLRKLLAVRFKKISFLPDVHIVERYFSAASRLGIVNDGEGLDYFLPEGFEITPLQAGFQENYVALAIGAQFATKQFPVHKIIELCRKSPQRFVIIGGPEDKARGEEIASACPNTLNVCGEYSLHGSALLVKNAAALVTNDTGMMHIGAAFNKKIISIWGNTVPEFGMYPYLPKDEFSIHEIKGLYCRPCSKIGYQACPLGHFDCMEKQNTDEIARDIDEKMRSGLFSG
ncbi:MAG: glycosyl transferase [Crocinitomicaceae bacterium]|nr:glycosyl transferase [Crocinitomicaceae bacterium]